MDNTVAAHVNYLWDCPSCNEANDEGDINPDGTKVTCSECGESFQRTGAM